LLSVVVCCCLLLLLLLLLLLTRTNADADEDAVMMHSLYQIIMVLTVRCCERRRKPVRNLMASLIGDFRNESFFPNSKVVPKVSLDVYIRKVASSGSVQKHV
jgi:hypothetical protein